MKARRSPSKPKLRICRWCYKTATVHVRGRQPGGFRAAGIIACGPPTVVSLFVCDDHEDRARELIAGMPFRQVKTIEQPGVLF